MTTPLHPVNFAKRFRGYLPVIIDVETGGLNPQKDALLEIAAVTLKMDEQGLLHPDIRVSEHIIPFEKANLDPEALKINKIDPYHPFRFAIEEKEALKTIFKPIREAIKAYDCQRAVLVGHNAWFDLQFLNAACERTSIKRNPFHPFTSFDTATLGALTYGQTVLARIAYSANIKFDKNEAHSAKYDAEQTALIFCKIVNEHQDLFQKVFVEHNK